MQETKKQVLRFVIAGLSAFGFDLGLYLMLTDLTGVILAKGFSFILGTTIAFLINNYWTFEQKKSSFKNIYRFSWLYTSTLLINVLMNQSLLILLRDQIFIAFVGATATSMVLNFFGQKFWVFKKT